MKIKLQGTTGFRSEFVEALPKFEQELIAHDLDASCFILTKENGTRWDYNYTVTVNGNEFTVTMTSDMLFLKYLYKVCFPPEESDQKHPPEHKMLLLLNRLKAWLTQDMLKLEDKN